MERIALVIGICIVVAIVVPMAVLAASARLRWALKVRLTVPWSEKDSGGLYRNHIRLHVSISASIRY